MLAVTSYIVRETPHPTVASDARSRRILMVEHQVMSCVNSHHSYSHDFVSHNLLIFNTAPESLHEDIIKDSTASIHADPDAGRF
jgi:hypothetical protein